MFKKLYIKYLKRLVFFTVFILALYIALQYLRPDLLSPFCIYLIMIFLVIMAATHAIVLRADAERLEYQADPEKNAEEQRKELTAIEKKFITRYMLATTVKLLFFLVLLLVYAFTNRQDLLRFGLNFVVLYLSYSIFEVLMLKKPLLK